jgi:hypothetical protein
MFQTRLNGISASFYEAGILFAIKKYFGKMKNLVASLFFEKLESRFISPYLKGVPYE